MEKNGKKYNQITLDERKVIEKLLRSNTPKRQIARLLNRSITTIRKEIKRGTIEQRTEIKTTSKRADIPLYESNYVYFAETAQNDYEKNRKNCGCKCKAVQCSEFLTYIEKQVKSKHWSLDGAAGYAKKNKLFKNTVTTQTLYNWVDMGICGIKNIDLPKKVQRKTHTQRVRQHKRIYGTSIEERPAYVDNRTMFGHWEGDGIVGKNKQGHLITLVERKTGIGLLFNVGDRKTDKIIDVLDTLEHEFGSLFPLVFKSITFDNGVEFANCKDMEKHNRTKIYYGVYTVRQVKGYEGVQLMPEFDVTISKNGEIYRYLINNATFESYLKFVKKDAETGKTVPLANTGVQLYDPDGNLIKMSYTYPTPTTIDTFYTNSEGWFVTPEKLKYGKGYSAVEVEAPHGYVLDSTPIYFDVTPNTMSDDNGITVVRISKSDKAQKGTIDITKLAESFTSVRFDGTYYQPVFSLTNNKGAEFKITAAEDITTPDGTIRAKKGEVVDNIIIGNGTTKSKPLYLGKYIVQETKAAPGCVLGNEAYEVTLSYAGQNIEITSSSLTITNERQKAEISLQKTLEQDELFGIGMNGEITNVRFALYCSEKLTASDGTSIPKDGLLEIINMNSDGTAVFNSDIPVGAKLYVQEYAADEHYQLSDKKYPVVFEYAGQETATVHISANNGEAINNELIRGSVLGKKVDEDGFTIAGALFGLFKNDETEFTKENAIMTCESNPIGIFMFKNIPYGNYIVREIQPAPAFALNETNYPVSITSHGQQIEITVENKFITGSVQVMKTDKLTGEKLSGAIFEVYVDVNSDKEYQKDIDKLVGTLDEMGAGIYQMNGLRYNGYFLCEKTAPTGFVKDDNYYYFQIANDLQVITIANGEGTEFVNAPIMGKVRIYKTDSTGKTPLKGAEFAVENSKGELIKTVVTDENGYAEFDLRYGEYFIYEKKAPAGYELNPEKAKINIKNDGQIINITVTNEKIKVEIPNTGADSSPMIYAVAALTVSSIAVIVLLVLRKKKQTKTKE